MKMAKVNKCEVSDCVYNTDNHCHALAITVGDGDDPMCDTFCQSSTKGGDADELAGVGACKVSNCKFNKQFECDAPEIIVSYHEQKPDCMTFESI